MDDKDDDKKRVLTPPADWADGLKPKTASNTRSEDENAEWQGNEDFQAPPQSTLSNGETSAAETSLNNPLPMNESESVAVHDGSTEGRLAPKLLWILTSISFIVTVGLWGLWLTEKSASAEEISALQNTIRGMKQSEFDQNVLIKNLSLEKKTLSNKVQLLEEQINALSLAQQPEPSNAVTVEEENGRTAIPPSQAGGDWFVNLESHRVEAIADARLTTLKPKLLPMNISLGRGEVNNKIYYRIRVLGFSSKAEATKASSWIESKLQAGPFWIGKVSTTTPEPKPKGLTRSEPEPTPRVKAKTPRPVQLRSFPSTPERWFIYVETFDNKNATEILIRELRSRGLNAMSTVESRSGELFYAVQIIDISSQAEGIEITERMRTSGFKNARMKKQVN